MEDLSPGVPTDLSKRYRNPSPSGVASGAEQGKSTPVGAFFSEAIQQPHDGTLYVELAPSSTSPNVQLYVIRDGVSYLLNEGNSLVAGTVYAFEVAYQADEQVNFKFGLNGLLGYIRVLYRRWV